MLHSRWERPQCSFYRSFGSAAAGKAAYRLIASPEAEVRFESLLAPHQGQTQRRMAAESVVLLAQDTTALSYNSLLRTTGLGPVGEESNPGRGLWLHSMHAFRLDGIALGCGWARLWARPPESDTGRRNEQSIDHMIVAWRALMLCRLGRQHPDLPATLYYDEQELAVLEVYKGKLPQHARVERPAAPVPVQPHRH